MCEREREKEGERASERDREGGGVCVWGERLERTHPCEHSQHTVCCLRHRIAMRSEGLCTRVLVSPMQNPTPIPRVVLCTTLRPRHLYRGPSLIINCTPLVGLCLGPYDGPRGGGQFPMKEVPLYFEDCSFCSGYQTHKNITPLRTLP